MHTIDIDRAVIADLANNNKDIRNMNMDIQKSQPQDTQKTDSSLKPISTVTFMTFYGWIMFAKRPVHRMLRLVISNFPDLKSDQAAIVQTPWYTAC